MKKLLYCSLFIFFLFISCGPAPSANETRLTILHTNDTHGRLLPFSYPASARTGSPDFRADIGGIARRAAIFRNLREELGRQKTEVWLVDAGDFMDGTAFSLEYRGKADVEAMNAAGYTFGVLGNHEFNMPLDTLKDLLNIFSFPVLSANAIETATGLPLTETSVIRNVGPVRVGIFGLVTRSAAGYPAARDGVVIEGEIETARRMVSELEPSTDIIILLSHCGENLDRRIAASVPGIDVIVGGHSHSRLPLGVFLPPSRSSKAGKPRGTVLVQAHQWGGELGRLDLVFTRDSGGNWHIEHYDASLIAVTADIPEDEKTAAVVNRYWQPIAGRYGEVIGRAAADFIDRGNDMTAYNLMADAVRETFGVELALENLGGVRAPLIEGDITLADLAAMDPFDNTIVTFTISGKQLRRILQTSRPAVSGIRYRVEDGAVVEATVAGAPLAESRMYSGAANSYFARTAMRSIKVMDSGRQRLDVLTDYVRKKEIVKPVFDGRRVIRQEGPARP
ncbi:MAG TPA: bifunctional UDP-sugar hydrolase/5'-nucleotidase [Acidobacteriota bacterium]|nr:bifunctional UDP-sugar hydrolase/5'-nucleotidase [Acidobacteriota bacterium]